MCKTKIQRFYPRQPRINEVKRMKLTHASLFSGIGGAELAASWLGWTNVFHCEIQEFQRKVLEYWFPNSISYEDITKTDFKEWRGQIDVLTGGFPCQPFSVAGKRKGAEDNRYLWGEMLRAIREIQPTWVVGENVNGILSMVQPGKETKMGRTDDLLEENYIYKKEQQFTIDAICEDLESAGYSVQPIVIPACAVGAPHRRDRVWIVAHRTNAGVKDLQQEGKNGVSQFATPTNTQCFGGNKVDYNIQSEQANGERADSKSMCRDSSDSCSQRCTRRSVQTAYRRKEIQEKWGEFFGFTKRLGCKRSLTKPKFNEFPTQSPVCRGNDGLPFRVADLTISFAKWRSKSIEALGNAWVPQVALEIFKVINEIQKKSV